MRLEEYLSIPYRLVAYSAPGKDGVWRRYAEYPEIGCVSEADTPTEAMEKLEEQRVQYIIEHVRKGEPTAALARQRPGPGAAGIRQVARGEAAPARRLGRPMAGPYVAQPISLGATSGVQGQSWREAMRAPSTSDSSLAKTISGWTIGVPANVPKPQSAPPMTRSRPTNRA